MNILLPKTPFVFNNGAAIVEGNLLYIYRPVDFRDLMYALTNAIYDDGRVCYYCGQEINERQRTMDHMFPQDFGGPTITNNLVPTCKKCNTTKGNLMEYQFKELMEIRDVEEAKALRLKIEKNHKKIHTGKIKVIPEEWISPKDYPINEIEMRMQVTVPLGKGYEHVSRRFQMYGTVLKPVIISTNKKLLDGFNVCLFAKVHDLWDQVSIIKLDNVIVMY